jgi:hypothetical protein
MSCSKLLQGELCERRQLGAVGAIERPATN